MKKFILLIASTLIFCGSKCKKDCHMDIKVSNKSSHNIILARRYLLISESKCRFGGDSILVGRSINLNSSKCWEEKINDDVPIDLYVLDANNYEREPYYYSCDSLEIKNKVLKHFRLYIDDLRALDFNIVFE